MRCPTAPSLPWVAWAAPPHVPRYDAPLRLPPCPSRSASRVARGPESLAGFQRSWSPFPARRPVEAPGPRQGLWSAGPPFPARVQGDRWLSHVPELPRWTHAPLSDPGGVLDPRHRAPRTAAFQRLHTVGFPLTTRVILSTTTIHISGLNDAACLLATPGFVRPLTGRHAGSLLTCWLDVSQVGLAHSAHPLGNNNPFHGVTSNPKVSGLPWREQTLVRQRLGLKNPADLGIGVCP